MCASVTFLLFSINTHPSAISSFFFFIDTATTEIYTLSLHDALPISPGLDCVFCGINPGRVSAAEDTVEAGREDRSEEHTSELQSHVNLVCRLLLEKKKRRKSKSI